MLDICIANKYSYSMDLLFSLFFIYLFFYFFNFGNWVKERLNGNRSGTKLRYHSIPYFYNVFLLYHSATPVTLLSTTWDSKEGCDEKSWESQLYVWGHLPALGLCHSFSCMKEYIKEKEILKKRIGHFKKQSNQIEHMMTYGHPLPQIKT